MEDAPGAAMAGTPVCCGGWNPNLFEAGGALWLKVFTGGMLLD